MKDLRALNHQICDLRRTDGQSVTLRCELVSPRVVQVNFQKFTLASISAISTTLFWPLSNAKQKGWLHKNMLTHHTLPWNSSTGHNMNFPTPKPRCALESFKASTHTLKDGHRSPAKPHASPGGEKRVTKTDAAAQILPRHTWPTRTWICNWKGNSGKFSKS